jgi:hypothetical protein
VGPFFKRSGRSVLVGNAAAAIQGAPGTTLDYDFMFRHTPLNMKKLKKVAVVSQFDPLEFPCYVDSGQGENRDCSFK